ncbi:excitatory amino acid transporter 3-like [Haliotis cracherodii]|uniref:excitatory amino acid transporter 3-like n=1 Tax=Haliotis cracherodii TaxID=6455 RepID=UPI0039ED2197
MDTTTSTEAGTLLRAQNMSNWKSKLRHGLKRNVLLIAIITSVVLGVILGMFTRRLKPSPYTVSLISVPGDLLMRMFKLLLLPLVSSSMVTGVANLKKSRGKLGIMALAYYLCTSVIATVLGIVLAITVRPGEVTKTDPLSDRVHDKPLPVTTDAILDLLRNIVPENIMQAAFQHSKTTFTKYMTEPVNTNGTTLTKYSSTKYGGYIWQKSVNYQDGMNVTGIMLFFAVFGVMLNKLGESGRTMVDLFHILNEITMNMTKLVMWYSPIGILFIITTKIIEVPDLETSAQQLAMYMVTGLLGLAIHSLIVLPTIYFTLTRQNPFRVSLCMVESLLTGLGTSSSAAALPLTIRCCEEKLKFSKPICRFVLPIGATINMDGLAIIQALTPIFLAQMNQKMLTFADLVAISLSATLASIGAAGVPGTGFITMLVVVAAVGLPVEDAYIVLSVDWFMMRMVTMVNLYNDSLAAGIFTKYFTPPSNSEEISN